MGAKRGSIEDSKNRFYQMIVALRSDYHETGEIPHLSKYFARFHVGATSKHFLFPHMMQTDKPTREVCDATYNIVSEHRKQNKEVGLSIYSGFPSTLFDEPNGCSKILTEEECIEFLKSKGYTISKTF